MIEEKESERLQSEGCKPGTIAYCNPALVALGGTESLADFTLNIGSLEHVSGYSKDRTRFIKDGPLADVVKQLVEEKRRDLLVVWFEKPFMGYAGQNQKRLKTINEAISPLGYKRVLVLGASAFGTHVIFDSTDSACQIMDLEDFVGKHVELTGRFAQNGKMTPYLVSPRSYEPIYLLKLKKQLEQDGSVKVAGVLQFQPGKLSGSETKASSLPFYFFDCRECEIAN
ncbi:MAG: hypothetical protein AB7W16_14905 [Candidatus Obscuribacterales bacterium]